MRQPGALRRVGHRRQGVAREAGIPGHCAGRRQPDVDEALQAHGLDRVARRGRLGQPAPRSAQVAVRECGHAACERPVRHDRRVRRRARIEGVGNLGGPLAIAGELIRPQVVDVDQGVHGVDSTRLDDFGESVRASAVAEGDHCGETAHEVEALVRPSRCIEGVQGESRSCSRTSSDREHVGVDASVGAGEAVPHRVVAHRVEFAVRVGGAVGVSEYCRSGHRRDQAFALVSRPRDQFVEHTQRVVEPAAADQRPRQHPPCLSPPPARTAAHDIRSAAQIPDPDGGVGGAQQLVDVRVEIGVHHQ